MNGEESPARDHSQGSLCVSNCLVVGIGNVLLGDDGIGPRVIEALQEAPLPDGVEALEGGTLGLELIHLFEGRSRIIFIDAFDGGEAPGALFAIGTPDVQKILQRRGGTAHEVGLADALHMAQVLSGKLPEITLIGVQPKLIAEGADLSPEVRAKIPAIVELVLWEIGPEYAREG